MASLKRIAGLLWLLSASISPAHCQNDNDGEAEITMLTGTRADASTATGPQPTPTKPLLPQNLATTSLPTDLGELTASYTETANTNTLPVVDQLNDGIRFLQAQVQWPTNGTVPHVCHTSCDLLDAGPLADWLTQVKDWVAGHPYDVVTVLLGNGNYSTPDKYFPAIEGSGILQYVYTPAVVPLGVEDWPTLGQLILSGQRVVMMLDYVANQTAYPWLLDEFTHMWETPFDPVDAAFPPRMRRGVS
ncbi:hypothetical protein N0V88_000956 [Collariella sp. IMI 366227]|nr:hypothetical protein N0V88_000956 [Collariella sp. IMI 366227]